MYFPDKIGLKYEYISEWVHAIPQMWVSTHAIKFISHWSQFAGIFGWGVEVIRVLMGYEKKEPAMFKRMQKVILNRINT